MPQLTMKESFVKKLRAWAGKVSEWNLRVWTLIAQWFEGFTGPGLATNTVHRTRTSVRIPRTGVQTFRTNVQVPGTGWPVPGARFQIPGTRYPNKRSHVPNTEHEHRTVRAVFIANPKRYNCPKAQNPTAAKNCLHFSILDRKSQIL